MLEQDQNKATNIESSALPSILKYEANDSMANEAIRGTFSSVSLASPLIAYLMYRCNVKVLDKCPMIQTAAAMVTGQGNYLLFDKDFLLNTMVNPRQRAFLMYHEVLHIFHRHVEVGQEIFTLPIEHQIANRAQDYYINYMAKGKYREHYDGVKINETNYKTFSDNSISTDTRMGRFLEMPEVGLYEDKYVGLSEYQIYHILKKEIENELGKSLSEIQKEIDQENQKIMNMIEKILGEEMDKHQSGGDGGDGGTMSDELKKQLEENRMSLIEAMSNAERSQNVGASERDLVDKITKMLKPVVTWKDRVRNFTTSVIPSMTTYNKLSRKSTAEIIFPTYYGDHINLVVGIDSSGSMGRDSDIPRCYSELIGLLNEYESWTLHLLTCDTNPYLIGTYTSDDYTGHTDIDCSIIGGGGTQMAPMINYASDIMDDEDIHACIIMTDGHLMDGDIESAFNPELPTIIMVTDGGNSSLKVNKPVDIIHCKK